MNSSYALNRGVQFIDARVPAQLKRLIKGASPSLLQGFYSLVRHMTADELTQVTIQEGLLEGRPFCCSLRNERPYWIGNWEWQLQDALMEYLGEGMVVYDIGAHLGFFSLLCAQAVGDSGQVHAFEPSPATRKTARRNFELNADLTEIIILHEWAIADTYTSELFATSRSASATAALHRVARSEREAAGQEIVVQSISIDEFVRRGNAAPDVIKMDIEGAETFAIRGMSGVLEKHRPVIAIELHNDLAWKEFCQMLSRCDYLGRRIGDRKLSSQPQWSEREQYIAIPSEHSADAA